MSGEKFKFNYMCVLRVAKEHSNQFFFKISYQICGLKCVNFTSRKTRKSLNLLQNVQPKKKVYFDSLPISRRKYDDLQSLINNKTFVTWPFSFFYSELKLEQEIFHVSGFSYIRDKCLCFHVCLKVKGLFDFSKFFTKSGFLFLSILA
jgi:hypothetical protein